MRALVGVPSQRGSARVMAFDVTPPFHRESDLVSPLFGDVLHGTVNGADATAVAPLSVQVTVCVPVPGFVFESVP
jgi:hypothetical protein